MKEKLASWAGFEPASPRNSSRAWYPLHHRVTHIEYKKGKVCTRAKWPIRPELIPVSVAWSDWEYFYSPLDGMLVLRRVTPGIKFAGTHLYIWVERGTVRVKCLSQEHNAMSPARARTRSARSGVERANHEATAPPLHGNFIDVSRSNAVNPRDIFFRRDIFRSLFLRLSWLKLN